MMRFVLRTSWIASALVALGCITTATGVADARPGGGGRGFGGGRGGFSRGFDRGEFERGGFERGGEQEFRSRDQWDRDFSRPDGLRIPESRPTNETGRGGAAIFRGERPSERELGDFLGLPAARTAPAASRSDGRVDHLSNVHGRWNHAIDDRADRQRLTDWAAAHPEHWNHLQDWGRDVREGWQAGRHDWFNDGWWREHPLARADWWHYRWGIDHPWRYWWSTPAWGALGLWLGADWGDGYYYDYGDGGNVAYENGQVLVNEDPVGSDEEFAQSAAQLATVNPPADAQRAASAEWMPLGTFAVSTSAQDTDGSLVVQLAVDRAGVISGTLYNRQTQRSSVIQGRVDKSTQRVAFNDVDDPDVVCETGIYNLLQPQASVLVHHGPKETENILFVRLDPPAATDDSGPSL